MSRSLLTLTILLGIAACLASALNVHDHWRKVHCNAPAKDARMSFQAFLKLENEELLSAYVGSAGGKKRLDTYGKALSELRAKYDTSLLERSDSIEASLSFWRGVLRPTDAVYTLAESWLASASASCVASWDSYTCTKVHPSAVAALFSVDVCTYADVRSGEERLFVDDSAVESDGTMKRLPIFLQTATGLTQYDPTEQPRRGLATASPTLPTSSWPATSTDGAPVVLSFALVKGVPTHVALAVYCPNGSPATSTSSGTTNNDWCSGTTYPTTVTFTVMGMNGATVGTAMVETTSDNCKRAENADIAPGLDPSLSDNIVCTFSHVDLQTGGTTLTTWMEYKVQAQQAFSSGAPATETGVYNYLGGANFAATIGNGTSEMTVINAAPLDMTAIKQQYGVVNSTSRTGKVVQAVLEFSQNSNASSNFSKGDLEAYLVTNGVVTHDSATEYVAKWLTIVNGNPYGEGFGIRGETSLDVEMMMGLFTEAPTIIWNMPMGGGSNMTRFGDALLAWAVNITSGNSGLKALPSVWSISYGGAVPSGNVPRCEVAFQMMAASGVTVHVASGDAGSYAASSPGNYPGTSENVITVGATAFYTNVTDGTFFEVPSTSAQSNVITSGGGFSSDMLLGVSPAQADHLAQFLQRRLVAEQQAMGNNFTQKDFDAKYPAGRRAVPDVAAIGAQITITLSMQPLTVWGTSASSPIFAAMVALANDRRVAAGMVTLSHTADLLYNGPMNMFWDVTEGNNCAGEVQSMRNNHPLKANFATFNWSVCYGSEQGFDLVTGLGTLNYTVFETAAMEYVDTTNLITAKRDKWYIALLGLLGLGGAAFAAIFGFSRWQESKKVGEEANPLRFV